MRIIALAAAITVAPTLLMSKDAAPDVWILSATCGDVLSVMADPFSLPDGSSPFTGAGYIGAVMGFSEAYYLAKSPEIPSEEMRAKVFGICQAKPDTLYKDAVAASFDKE